MSSKASYTTITLQNGETLKLSKQQAEFARLFAISGDATNSRLQAGYANHSSNRQDAYKILQYPKVQQAVEHYKTQAAKKLDISENRILAEMAAMGFSNVANLYNADNSPKNLQDLDKATQRAIKKVKTKRYMERTGYSGEDGDDYEEVEVLEIELHPKLPALTKIAEIKGLSAPKDPQSQKPVNVNVSVNGKSVKVDDDSD